MKKTLLLLVILCGAVFAAHAQTDQPTPPIQLGIGIDGGTAVGPTKQTYGFADGVSAKFELPFPGQKVSFVLSIGITNYTTNSSATADTMQNGHYVPIEVGFKYFIYKGMYIEGDAGESLNINSGYMGYQSEFIYSPAIGVSIPLKQPYTAVDIGLRYESRISADGDINQVALRVAYKFGL